MCEIQYKDDVRAAQLFRCTDITHLTHKHQVEIRGNTHMEIFCNYYDVRNMIISVRQYKVR